MKNQYNYQYESLRISRFLKKKFVPNNHEESYGKKIHPIMWKKNPLQSH